MPHSCRTVVISCLDFRFQSGLRRFLVSRGRKDNYDLLSVAGSAKDLSGTNRGYILKQIEISCLLHGVKEVYLIHHLDCGAYGGSQSFKNLKDEKSRHLADLVLAERIICKKFPHLIIKKYLAELSGRRVIFSEIK